MQVFEDRVSYVGVAILEEPVNNIDQVLLSDVVAQNSSELVNRARDSLLCHCVLGLGQLQVELAVA